MNAPRGRNVADADRDVRQFLIRIAGMLGELLGDRLIALYVLGSLATGAFHRERSDLNLLGVVNRPLSDEQRERTARLLVKLSEERPIPGDIDVDVVTEHGAKHFTHPVSYEVRHAKANRKHANATLAARILEVRERGVTLVGPSPDRMFAPVPWHAYIGALQTQLEETRALAERDPVTAVLDACRVLFGSTNPNMHAVSKDEAAVWALRSAPDRYHSTINDALQIYRGTKHFDDVVFAPDEVLAFGEYVRERSQSAFDRAGDNGEEEE